MTGFDIKADIKKIRRTSAGALILREANGEWHVLILRAWAHWDFPKGSVEKGETLMQAAIREVSEETGISDLSFPWGKAFARTPVYSRDKVAYYAIGSTATERVILDPNPETGLVEHDEFRWVPWLSLHEYLSPRLHCIMEWAAKTVGLPSFVQAGLIPDPTSAQSFSECVKSNQEKMAPRPACKRTP